MRYWKRIDSDGKTTTVEQYSHDIDVEGAIEITKQEFNARMDSLPPVTESVRDLSDELRADVEGLKLRIKVLEDSIKLKRDK